MKHPFPPLCGEKPEILILGTFPSPLSRDNAEYYGNPRNQFWRIIFDVFGETFDNPDYSRKCRLLTDNHIALWDVVASCEPQGAADSNLRELVYNTALPQYIAENNIRKIIFNGGNAYAFYRRGNGEVIQDYRVLPSTSPANARYSYAQKLSEWTAAVKAER